MINVGFIGAGSRATGGHYPVVAQLHREGAVRWQSICDLDAARLDAARRRFDVAHAYADYRRMLDEVELDAVYVIMPPQYSLQIVLDCLDAGKHVLVEKPPATSGANLQRMSDAARRTRRVTAVGFQRRYSPVTQEVRRMVAERGPVTLCHGAFHKNKLLSPDPRPGASLLLDHIDHVIHAVDLVRYLCGGDATEVHVLRDTFFATWPNTYNAVMRFSSGAVGGLSASCSSASRVLRFEVHGKDIYAEMELPKKRGFIARVWADGSQEPKLITGETLSGERETDAIATRELHRSFVAAIENGGETPTSFEECLGTMRLVELLERG